ncbi:hypothetical protein [Arthrobacter sp. I3]|uniref:hypothetical protein n=1 Tax=Arthrobacter sp. I3 TaxID=218158 RepID=UPI000483768C|nr:hypothetical protein [Arthrobacter sp. I3]
MSYREDNVSRMFTNNSKGSQTVPRDDRQESPQRPYKPWHRQEKVWALIALVVLVVGMVVSAATGQSGPFSLLIFGAVVILVLVNMVTRSMGWVRRGWKRLNDRA